MQQLTSDGQNLVADIAQRYNLSHDSVINMLIAVNNGGGTMAQFYCPELGGNGQWMQGGMTMVGDMFNTGLQNTVNNLCNELSNALATQIIFPPLPKSNSGFNHWWPQELGQAFSIGSQNNTRYAIFPQRLALETNGQVKVYDTLDHQISGVSQQQGGYDSLSFNSQFGSFSVDSLPLAPEFNLGNNQERWERDLVEPSANLNQEPSAGFNQEPSAKLNQEPSASFNQEPSASFNQEPSAGFNDQPSAGFNNQPSDSFNSQPYASTASNEYSTAQNANVDLSSSSEIIQLIEKLSDLKSAGALTDDEFSRKKTELLQRI